MLLIFVHGWSVTDTNTYGRLPEAIAHQANQYGLNIDIKHVWLGRYISFHDDVSLVDIARALNRALVDEMTDATGQIAEFSCITHSTGGPVVREWLRRFYGQHGLLQAPIRHLIMLAPANHGSPLAALGKARLGRIKAWFSGVEPGERILQWLSLASPMQKELARHFIDNSPADNGVFTFVLTGQTIDKKLYDFLNPYLVEAGSDGVVRVAGANMNFSMVRLVEGANWRKAQHGQDEIDVHELETDGEVLRPEPVPLGVIPGASHSGRDKGIMRSVLSTKSPKKPQVQEILRCLCVTTKAEYQNRTKELETLTASTQARSHQYAQLVFNIRDDQNDPINDYDLFLLGGPDGNPDKLTKGFFIDRQQNKQHPSRLVYYVDHRLLTKNKLTGFRVIARPQSGFSFYHAAEYRSNGVDLNELMKPNETFYVEIQLKRCLDKNVFRLDSAADPKLHTEGMIFKTETRRDFKKTRLSNEEAD